MITDKVEVTFEDEKRLIRKLGNWVILSKYLSKASEKDILKLMVFEIKGRRRLDIIHRLHARYNTLRRTREKKEIIGRLI